MRYHRRNKQSSVDCKARTVLGIPVAVKDYTRIGSSQVDPDTWISKQEKQQNFSDETSATTYLASENKHTSSTGREHHDERRFFL